ncbi:site-2 protease family protein, partial [Burkholderia cepacia]|nr:site-2 protease family protein [Burkholderia cepacia]
TEAYVGLGGPLAGTVASLACYFAARSTGSDLLLALSYAGFFINLFNLIPLSPFDGGRITAVLSPRIWLVGVPVLVALFFWRPSPILILVAV